MEVEAALREQARGCAVLGSPMYAALLARLADDLAAGGATARLLVGHEHDPGPSALALRLLGSVHRLVLERRAGAVAAYYPSVGGTWHDDAGSAAVIALLDDQPDAVREWLDRPPQTNEPGRAAVLVGALGRSPELLHHSVRLVELGASGGLNLLADLLHPGLAPGLRVVERLGCDPRPIDVRSTEGRLALTAYVWPDQPERHERLRRALDLAARHPVTVRRAGAAELLADLDLEPGTATVVWHSVMWQYLAAGEQQAMLARLDELGRRASADAPLVHLAMEPRRRAPDGPHQVLVTLRHWPDAPDERVLGVAAPHGPPVLWE